MLNSDKPRREVSQAPLKQTLCYAGCGCVVVYRTNSKILCDRCRLLRQTGQARIAAERQRRKRGIAQVKGTVISCSRCNIAVVRRNVRHKFCDSCSQINNLERANERSVRVRRAKGCVAIGTEKMCQHCNVPFRTHSKGKIVYCEACRILQKTGKLPSLKALRKSYWKNVLQPRYYNDPEFREKSKRQQAESRERRKTNPAFSINERMSASIRGCLKGEKRGNSWETLVGYTLDDLMRHLERQFRSGMSWERRGEWEIDHIIPLISFTFSSTDDPEFKRCWGLPNLRPLWRVDNNHKRANRTHLL